VFESSRRLREELLQGLEALIGLGDGRWAALFDRQGVHLESPIPESGSADDPQAALRLFVRDQAAALFGIPAALQAGRDLEDHFAAFAGEEFFLAFVNGRVGLLVACADAQRIEDESGPLLRLLVDRLLRLEPRWRLDEKGRGILAARPRLDTVVIGREDEADA
jgi:hypothetical protein